MPRCNRHFLPGLIWHITHRCHKKEFLLKFSRDRSRWRHWLFEARKRHGLCVLNYIVTSNHVHLLVRDLGNGEISSSMQLIAGRIGQEFNRRKSRKGAFWEDRYHATAVESGDHLARCLVYIDLNMVRAGVISHPMEWEHGGYREIQRPLRHHRVIDLPALMEALEIQNLNELRHLHRSWLNDAQQSGALMRDDRWTQSVAVGSEAFVKQVQMQIGIRARSWRIETKAGVASLQEEVGDYDVDFGVKTGIGD